MNNPRIKNMNIKPRIKNMNINKNKIDQTEPHPNQQQQTHADQTNNNNNKPCNSKKQNKPQHNTKLSSTETEPDPNFTLAGAFFFAAGDFTLFGFGAFFAGAAFFDGVVLVQVLATFAFGFATGFAFAATFVFGFAVTNFALGFTDAAAFAFGFGLVETFFALGATLVAFGFATDLGFAGAETVEDFFTGAAGTSLNEFFTLMSFPEATSFRCESKFQTHRSERKFLEVTSFKHTKNQF
ncbi:hypothetical protein CMV_006555 [Castanea mollissima]|uniref:Uncharacterized protein n=1 Tax=Castanea mollissima TaxID=60419 RepID=A0A8J4W3H2_9ROSI|nr:hypothetical protein CMV_006555 [Castanea mollissima]